MLFIESKTPNYTISPKFSLPAFAYKLSVPQPLLADLLSCTRSLQPPPARSPSYRRAQVVLARIRPPCHKSCIFNGSWFHKTYNVCWGELHMKRASESKRNNAPSFAALAAALGAVAIGAVAIGALAIGRLAIRRLSVGRAKIKSLEIQDLSVRRLRVSELDVRDSLKLPPSASLENTEWE
jgi:hypothetical protein